MEYFANLRELTRDLVWPAHPDYTEGDYPDLHGKVYIVTGASAGIGFESAKLLSKQGAKVYITGRTPEKVEQALAELNSLGEAYLLPIHHEDLSSVGPAIKEFLAKEKRLDGIVHNAGINYRGQNILEPHGLLDIIVINVLSGQLIQTLLKNIIATTPGSRTLWISSAIHYHSPPNGGIDFSNMNVYDSGSYLGQGNGMYGQTKAMNIYQAVQWGKKLPSGVSVAVHPGTVTSDIRRHNKWRGLVLGSISKPTIWGAYQILKVLLHPSVTPADNGSYYIPFAAKARVRPDVRAGAEGDNGDKFWNWISEQIKPYLSS